MKKKNILLFCFLLVLTVSAFISSAAAQEIPDIRIDGDWAYQLNGTGITIIAYLGNETDVEIPAKFEDIYVNQLAEELFSNDLRIERVVIPPNVSAIGKFAFQGCVSLKEVRFPYYLKNLSEGTFKGCVSLENVTLPVSLSGIGKEAFAGCEYLREIVLPKNIGSIGESAFENCKRLVTVRIVTTRLTSVDANAFKNTAWLNSKTDEFVYIGRKILLRYNGNEREVSIPYGTVTLSNVFENNKTVEKVILPETVRRIGQNAFKNAVNLTSVNIPEYVTRIDSGAFQGCISLEHIEFPRLLSTVGTNAFYGCEKLEELIFPPKVNRIQTLVAAYCPNLTVVKIPEIVTSFSKYAFEGSERVQLQVAPESDARLFLEGYGIPYSYYTEENEDYIYSRTEHGMVIIKYIGNGVDVSIPENINGERVTGIGSGAFQNNANVRRVIVPSGVTAIGDWAFSNMEVLEYVKLPSGLKNLGSYMFAGSGLLPEIRVPHRVLEFGEEPFDTDTKICVDSGTKAERTLKKMGYSVVPTENCEDLDVVLQNFGEYDTLYPVKTDNCDCSVCSGEEGTVPDLTVDAGVPGTNGMAAEESGAPDGADLTETAP